MGATALVTFFLPHALKSRCWAVHLLRWRREPHKRRCTSDTSSLCGCGMCHAWSAMVSARLRPRSRHVLGQCTKRGGFSRSNHRERRLGSARGTRGPSCQDSAVVRARDEKGDASDRDSYDSYRVWRGCCRPWAACAQGTPRTALVRVLRRCRRLVSAA